MFSDTWAQQNASGSGSKKSPNSKGGAERWFSSGPLVTITRRGVERRCLVCCVHLYPGWSSETAAAVSWGEKLVWELMMVSLKSLKGSSTLVRSHSATVRGHSAIIGHDRPDTWWPSRAWGSAHGMAKGLHVDVLATKTCGFEGQHQLCCQTSPLGGILFLFMHWYKAQVLWL